MTQEIQSRAISVASIPVLGQIAVGISAALTLGGPVIAGRCYGYVTPEFIQVGGAAIVIGLIAMGVTYFRFCQPVRLTVSQHGIEKDSRGNVTQISFDEITSAKCSWRDIRMNGVYNSTYFRFTIKTTSPDAPRVTFDGFVGHGTIKFQQLELIDSMLSSEFSSNAIA